MYGTGLLPVRRDCLPLATRKIYSDFNIVCLLCLSCCLLLVYVFLLLVFDEENVLFAEIQPIQDNPNRISR